MYANKISYPFTSAVDLNTLPLYPDRYRYLLKFGPNLRIQASNRSRNIISFWKECLKELLLPLRTKCMIIREKIEFGLSKPNLVLQDDVRHNTWAAKSKSTWEKNDPPPLPWCQPRSWCRWLGGRCWLTACCCPGPASRSAAAVLPRPGGSWRGGGACCSPPPGRHPLWSGSASCCPAGETACNDNMWVKLVLQIRIRRIRTYNFSESGSETGAGFEAESV